MSVGLQKEQDLARRIREFEMSAWGALQEMPETGSILQERPTRNERTRAGSLKRMERAFALAQELATRDSDYMALSLEAGEELKKAEELRWELAMSAQYVAQVESRKLSSPFLGAEDLLQEGYIGLLKAAARFDPDRGIRFSTYARWWVRAQMARSIETTGRMVRLPGGAVEQLRYLREAASKLEQDGQTYDIAALSKETGIEVKRAEMLLMQGGICSIDQEDDSGLSMKDSLKSDGASPHDEASQRESLQILEEQFEEFLDAREKYIIVNHYGLGGGSPRTMADIGKSIGLSRERIRQIEVGALRRLRGIF
jgi:RNA polymerase nonessential primary-like sigma factor